MLRRVFYGVEQIHDRKIITVSKDRGQGCVDGYCFLTYAKTLQEFFNPII